MKRTEIKTGTLLILNETRYGFYFLPMVVEYRRCRGSVAGGMMGLIHIVADARFGDEIEYPSLFELTLDYTPIEEIAQRK